MQERVLCNPVAIKKVADELGLSVKEVKEMVNIQSEFTKEVMQDNSFNSIRWPYLGIFKSKPKEIQMINHLRGMTPEQQKEFKFKVRTRQIRLNDWENDTRKP